MSGRSQGAVEFSCK